MCWTRTHCNLAAAHTFLFSESIILPFRPTPSHQFCTSHDKCGSCAHRLLVTPAFLPSSIVLPLPAAARLLGYLHNARPVCVVSCMPALRLPRPFPSVLSKCGSLLAACFRQPSTCEQSKLQASFLFCAYPLPVQDHP
ncbi:hypothetical protein EON66_06520 [archaeon]|nr:MAG: hypothetical protein EON66_06520 [archaeon]